MTSLHISVNSLQGHGTHCPHSIFGVHVYTMYTQYAFYVASFFHYNIPILCGASGCSISYIIIYMM